ncbi:MAG TPA: hypothetical protein PLZ93_02495 [Nocardioides sp.]|uniref:hypothetical protein n=1 Tax=uncultured Nocardioides sp. TaxID=198441 RepID=UPI00261593EC|nr:hypothetical protein [uncultured Nocardioides sp.]HRI94465.1 hypothetical protein [Nocardioides sp.]HRK44491.1 hypothetical protein [Nocardioides sp.]
MVAADRRWWPGPFDVETFAMDAVGRVCDAVGQVRVAGRRVERDVSGHGAAVASWA